MALKLYNTLSRKKEVFRPRKGKRVNLFVCGPTVYDFSHIGHARTYIVFDLIVKYLKEKRYNVFYLENITDIDDKIIKRAKEKKISPRKLARDFEKEYLKDVKDLKINSVNRYARATDHIQEIISQVKRLLKKGYAYKAKDGVYYDISKFKNYGKLSRRTVLQAEDAVCRIDKIKGKRNKGDFCLWKISKPGEPKWKSPWGLGRPGWHIEDTAITEKYFGPQYDIHGGGKDLIFPHHEAEIAQMEAISGKRPMVRYWLHPGFLTVRGQKMAKSLGNFITIRNFLKNESPRLLRFLALKSHYRSPLDYNEKNLSQTKRELEKIDEFVEKLARVKTYDRRILPEKDFSLGIKDKLEIEKKKEEFNLAIEDDFNTPKALSVLFNLVNKGNSLIAQNKISGAGVKSILDFLKKVDKIFNFIFWQKKEKKPAKEVLELVKKREKFRRAGQWKSADEMRKKIKELGFWVEDTKEGPKVKKV